MSNISPLPKKRLRAVQEERLIERPLGVQPTVLRRSVLRLRAKPRAWMIVVLTASLLAAVVVVTSGS